MAVKPIPDGYHAVTPYLIVNGVGDLIEFLKKAFGATQVHRTLRDDGSIQHAEVRIGDSPVMMGEASGPAAGFGPAPASFYLYVTDCDAVYQKVLEAGAVSVSACRYAVRRSPRRREGPEREHVVDRDAYQGRGDVNRPAATGRRTQKGFC